MPIVPFDKRSRADPAVKPIPAEQEPWVLMAAAQMDAQGRLVEPSPTKDSTNAE